jgi:preprotein translocase subunit YajC
MFITPAYAQSAAAGPDPITSLLPFILIFVIMYFLLIRPQQKRLKEHRAMITALKRGDRVVTAGGLVGKVTAVGTEESDEITLEVAQNVKVTAIKSTITAVLSKPEPANTK